MAVVGRTSPCQLSREINLLSGLFFGVNHEKKREVVQTWGMSRVASVEIGNIWRRGLDDMTEKQKRNNRTCDFQLCGDEERALFGTIRHFIQVRKSRASVAHDKPVMVARVFLWKKQPQTLPGDGNLHVVRVDAVCGGYLYAHDIGSTVAFVADSRSESRQRRIVIPVSPVYY